MDGVGRLEEDKADEEGDEDAQSCLGVDVRRRAPVLLEDTEQNLPELAQERSSKLAVAAAVLLLGGDVLGVVGQTLELGLDLGVLLAVPPGLVPVDVRLGSRGSTDDLEHPLGRVRVVRAREATVGLEVLRHGSRVLADVAEVDSLAALGQEEQAVESLEEHGRRLMNSTQDGLAALGQLLEKIQNSPRRLTVKTRGGLVDKEKQRRLRSQLNTDGKTLSLFDVETLARNADDGIGVLLHLQQPDDLVHIRQLLLARGVGRLAEEGTEVESFADGGGLQMEVLLLHIARLALERGIAGVAVDKHITGNHAHARPVGQTVEQGGLAGARHAHESGECSRLDPTVDVVQNLSYLALDLDLVAHISPVEGACSPLNIGLLIRHVAALLLAGGNDGSGNLDTPRLGIVLVLLEGSRLVSTAEDQHLALGLLGRDVLSGEHVHDEEPDHEGNQDAKVPPLMRVVVPEARIDVVVAADEVGAGHGADGRTDAVGSRDILVTGHRRAGNELGTGELLVVELVDDETLEGVGQGIQVVEPAAPAKHVVDGDDEAGEDDERKNDDGSRHHGLRQRPGSAGNGPEHHGHGEDRKEGDQEEVEEGAGLSPQARHEIQRDVEGNSVDHLVGHVAQHGRDGLGGRMVESVTVVLLDNGALGVQRQNLQSTGEGVHETGEE